MLRKSWIRFALILLVGSAIFAVQSCLKVDDSITGLAATDKGVADCIRACVADAKSKRDAERALHTRNVRVCRGRRSCVQQEAERHAAAMRQIADEERECKAGCHNQGGARGGQ